jgi:hypothetical protein
MVERELLGPAVYMMRAMADAEARHQDAGVKPMVTEPTRIDFDDFAKDIQTVFERIRRSNEAVLIVRGEDVYRVERALSTAFLDYDARRVRKALQQSAGALRGVDREELLSDIRAQREQNDRMS